MRSRSSILRPEGFEPPTYGLEGRLVAMLQTLRAPYRAFILPPMTLDTEDGELLISLEQILVVQNDSIADSYDDNYVRRHAGPISLVDVETEKRTEIGEIELFYIDGTRALDNGLNIVDVCDSVGQEVYEYATAVYVDGVLDTEIVGETFSNDVLALHTIAILPEFRGREYGLRVTKKIVETVGNQCGAVVLRPSPMQFLSVRAANVEWMERLKMEEFDRDQDTAAKRLVTYWQKLNLGKTRDPSMFLVHR